MYVNINLGNWHQEAAKKVYKKFYIKLITTLPMNNAIFSELLREKCLFPGVLLEQVQTKTTITQKASSFLDKGIEHSLRINTIPKPLYKLLTAMRDEPYLRNCSLKELAANIKQELDEKTSIFTSSGWCIMYI